MAWDDDEPLDFDILADHIGIQIHIARRALWQMASARLARRDVKAPPGYVSAFILIGANPGITQKRIAAELFLDAGTVVDIVDLLEREGLAERRRDPSDRRRVKLNLTGRGAEACDAVRERSRVQKQELAAKLTSEEAETLVRLLKAIRSPG